MDAHESENPKSNFHENNDGSHGSNRHGKSKSSWGLSTAVHAVHGVGFVTKKVFNNRLTESLWHTRKGTTSTSIPSDASDIPDAKRENHEHEQIHHHTAQSSLNIADEQSLNGRNVDTTGSDVDDISEDTKPIDGSHVKQNNQHRRSSNSRTGSNVVDHLGNSKPSVSSHAKQVNHQHRWPGTKGSNVLSKNINHALEVSRVVPNLRKISHHKKASKPQPESSSENTNPPSSSRVDDGSESQPSSPNKSYVSASRGVSPSRTTVLTSASGNKADPSRGVSPTSTRGVGLAPTGGASPTPTKGVGTHTRDVSPTPVKPSSRRHFFNVFSILTKMVDNKKEKHEANPQDISQNIELLYNIQVQWQFANASAEAALDHQRETAEKSLFNVWRTVLELRDSISSKKIDVALLILQLKLYAVLYRQMAYMDEWASLKNDHESALFATTNDLQARSLSVPIIGGVEADIRGLKLILFSTIQVLQATISCIKSTLSKLDKTHFMASELANLVLHERALLDECEIFLASAAPLHIEECSLRSYLLQFNRTSMTE